MENRLNGLIVWLLALTMGVNSVKGQSKEQTVQSPDGAVVVEFQVLEGKPYLDLQKNGKEVLKLSQLGLVIKDKSNDSFVLTDQSEASENLTWKPVWDKFSEINDHYNETIFKLKGSGKNPYNVEIVIRVYDDAMAIRYKIPQQKALDKFTISGDRTTFVFGQDHTFWAANGENHNIGPALLSQYSSATGTVNKGNSTAIEINKTGHTPIVMNLGDVGYMALLEAAIYDYAYFDLVTGDVPLSLKCHMAPSKGETPAQTSWRVLLLGNKPGDLVESNTLVNLNPECAIEDTSWIQPGKSVWDWRAWGYKAINGFTYGLNTESHKRLIDFASKKNVKYLLMDADWYGPEFSADADPTSANERINIEENMAYAKSKGVGIILYLNDVGAKKFGLEKILKQFRDWGASGVKYGFMTSQGQEKVLYTRKVVELCAKYKLTVNFHDGPVPPSGDRRTWPNLVTREYGHSQADAKKSYYPETVVNQVFINMISGPLDMCNGWFGFEGAESRPRVFEKIPGTVAAEVAKIAALFSGIHVLPDVPEEYDKKADLFDFIETLPDTFDELRIIDGQIDEFVTVGRRKGSNWYLGTLTNRDSRKVIVSLDFLKEGATYKAMLYEDGPNAHYENNRESYNVREQQVKKGDRLKLQLAPGGGHAIKIIKN